MRLARQSGVYALGNLGVKASGLLLAVYYLDPEYLLAAEYGRLALLDALARFALLVGGLGLPTGLIRYAARNKMEGRRETWVSTAWLISLGLGATVAALGWLGAPLLAGWLLGDPMRTTPVALMAVYVGMKVVAEVPFAYVRVEERPGLFVAAVAAEAVLLVGGVAVLVGRWGMGLDGVLYAYVLSAAGVALPLSLYLLARSGLTLSPAVGRQLVVFGAPLVVAGLSSRFLNLGDRFIIAAMEGPEQVALYDWASRLSGVVNMLFVQGFQLSFTVLGLKAAGTGGALHRSAFRHFAALTGWAVLAIALFSVDLTRLVAEDSLYLQIEPLVLPVGLGYLFYGLYFVAVNTLYATGNTKRVAWTVFAASALNAALNVALIPVLGVIGAAVATLVAYVFLAWSTAQAAERASGTLGAPLDLPWSAVYQAVGVLVGLWLVGTMTADWPLLPRLAGRSALVLAYVPALFAIGLYDRSDLRRGVEWARGLRRR